MPFVNCPVCDRSGAIHGPDGVRIEVDWLLLCDACHKKAALDFCRGHYAVVFSVLDPHELGATSLCP